MCLVSSILSLSIKGYEVANVEVRRADDGRFYSTAYVGKKGIWYAPTEHGHGITSSYFNTPSESLVDLKTKLEYYLTNVPCKNEKLREGR